MNADEKLAALGLAHVEVIEVDEYNRLPGHRRAVITSPEGARFVRLPDPPPVAALRRILVECDALVRELPNDEGGRLVSRVHTTAYEALAEFDGTTT